MDPLIAAGLFDNPWIVLAFLAAGAIINWLSQRRLRKQQKRAEQEQATGEAVAPPGKPAEEFDVEDALRRLLGEEPKRPLAPPPIPRAVPPPVTTWNAETSTATVQVPPQLRPPPIVTVLPGRRRSMAAQQLELTARQVEPRLVSQTSAGTTTGALAVRRSRARQRSGWDWHNPRSARQAFVASLVFSPPKGLEP
jgi:hypothetical protein